jgi:hypothetical protein
MIQVLLSGYAVIYWIRKVFDMSGQPKNNENQSSEGIDDIIDDAVENAEARRELSDEEMDDVAGGVIAGGIKLPIMIGIIATDNSC